MFLNGSKSGVVISVQPISIHGTIMYDVTFQLANEASVRTARIGPEAVSGQLAPGSNVKVVFLMNVVTAMQVV